MQSQLEQLEQKAGIEWQEFKISELFEVGTVKGFDEGKLSLFEKKQSDFIEFIGRTRNNNGVKGYLKRLEVEPNLENVISVSQIGTVVAQIRVNKWYASQNIFILNQKDLLLNLSPLYLTAVINKSLGVFSDGYSNYPTLESLKKLTIQLPTIKQNDKSLIAFDFIETFIATLNAERLATLNAYLKTTNLKDYALTKDEQAALDGLDTVTLGTFSFHQLFDSIVQGRRLKKQDQVSGKMPFVMAGVTNTGVVDYIGNEVRIFPKNSLTVDIFGNVFYRSYEYGMGDDTGAYWNTDNHISKSAMLYLATTMQRFMVGKFDFGHKLRSSRSTDFKIQVPINPDQTPNYAYMSLVISAMQKIVIKNVVDYLDVRIEKTGHMVG